MGGGHGCDVHRYIKAVGAGAKRARALSREEAFAAMSLVAEGRAEPVQVGAFLLALRMKGETPEELAGFADAFSAHVERVAAPEPGEVLEVDAHGDGHEGIPSMLVAAACAVVAEGIPVCLAVDCGSPFARHGLDGALAAIGLDGPLPPSRAASDLARAGIAAADLALACPPLARMVALRPFFGLRTAAQTIAKLVSSFSPASTRRIAGVFHAPYLESTAAALALVGVEQGLVVQAIGGLPEARPGKILRVADLGALTRTPPRTPSRTIDLRAFAAEDQPTTDAAATAGSSDDTDAVPATTVTAGAAARASAAAATRAALDGKMPEAKRAAAAAAVLLHAATGADPLAAARAALATFTSGRARAAADRLRLPPR